MNELDEAVAEIETELSLKSGFFSDLKNDEDWTFLIKSHAILEAVCSHLLTSYFEDPKFKDIFSRLEMSNTKTGKVAFLKAAGLILKDEAHFIQGLSALRNQAVHSLRGIHFTFSDHISRLDKQQKKAFVDTFGFVYVQVDARDNHIVSEPELVISDPKTAIWLGVTFILAIVKAKVDTRFFKDQLMKTKLELFEKNR